MASHTHTHVHIEKEREKKKCIFRLRNSTFFSFSFFFNDDDDRDGDIMDTIVPAWTQRKIQGQRFCRMCGGVSYQYLACWAGGSSVSSTSTSTFILTSCQYYCCVCCWCIESIMRNDSADVVSELGPVLYLFAYFFGKKRKKDLLVHMATRSCDNDND